MKKKNFVWSMLTIMTVGMMSVSFVSCGGDDDAPTTPVSEPANTIASKDPEGTQVVNILIDGYSDIPGIGELFIDKAGNFNFHNYYVSFAMVGKVNGLADITKIPENENAWARSVRVNVGDGYIIRKSSGNNIGYARIYVPEAIINGYVIKYQSPFEPQK